MDHLIFFEMLVDDDVRSPYPSNYKISSADITPQNQWSKKTAECRNNTDKGLCT
ncbi:hypothetical protein PHMEG_00032030, partial [Phytophthora megakarya]